MTDYIAIANSEVSQDKPATQALFRKLRDNVLAMFEGASNAPRMSPAALASYHFFVRHQATAKTYNTASSAAQIEFTDKIIDKGNYWDSSSAPYCIFKPLSAGFYEIEVSLVITRNATNDINVRLRKNGNTVAEWTVLAGSNNAHRSVSTVASLNGSTDYVDVAVLGGGGSVTVPIDGMGQSYIKGKKIAE